MIVRISVPATPLRMNSADDFLGLAHASVAVASSAAAVTAAVVDAARRLRFLSWYGYRIHSAEHQPQRQWNAMPWRCAALPSASRPSALSFLHFWSLSATSCIAPPLLFWQGQSVFVSGVLCCPLLPGRSRMLDKIVVQGLTVHPCLCTP
jgi:hypothetical protein